MHLLITGTFTVALTWTALYRFLLDLPARLGMQVIFGPAVHKREGDWLGFVIIAESHVSIHTSGATAFVDVFSCKEFEVETALAYIGECFQLSTMDVHLLERIMPAKEPVRYPNLPIPQVVGVS